VFTPLLLEPCTCCLVHAWLLLVPLLLLLLLLPLALFPALEPEEQGSEGTVWALSGLGLEGKTGTGHCCRRSLFSQRNLERRLLPESLLPACSTPGFRWNCCDQDCPCHCSLDKLDSDVPARSSSHKSPAYARALPGEREAFREQGGSFLKGRRLSRPVAVPMAGRVTAASPPPLSSPAGCWSLQ